MRVVVYGSRDPNRFAGFPDYDSFVSYLESRYGPGENMVHDSLDPLNSNYEIDPALETLMSSAEFHKLSKEVKAEILKDKNLQEAFAKFLNSGGHIVVDDARGQYATWAPGPPPVITLPNTFLNPMSTDIDRAVFALAHEIYHNEYQTYDGITPESWAHNEAIATLEAYQATQRMGLYVDGDGLGVKIGGALPIIRNSTSDSEAIEKMEEHFLKLYPGS